MSEIKLAARAIDEMTPDECGEFKRLMEPVEAMMDKIKERLKERVHC